MRSIGEPSGRWRWRPRSVSGSGSTGRSSSSTRTGPALPRAATSAARRLQPPSSGHWLGTDGYGRDVLTRVIWGSRVSLEIGFVATGLSLLVGTLLGGTAGYFGGGVDTAIMRVADVFLAVPSLFLILVVVALFGASLGNTELVIGLVTWAQFARIVRGECLALRARDFVDAARALGASHPRILAFADGLRDGLDPALRSGA